MTHPGSPEQPYPAAPTIPAAAASAGHEQAPRHDAPPQGYGPPAAGYGQGAPGYPGYPQPYGAPALGALPPDRHIGWAIASLVLFWPLCIPSFIASMKVSDLWFTGRYQEAVQASADAKRWGKLGVIIGASLFGAMILFYVIVFAVVVTHAPEMQ